MRNKTEVVKMAVDSTIQNEFDDTNIAVDSPTENAGTVTKPTYLYKTGGRDISRQVTKPPYIFKTGGRDMSGLVIGSAKAGPDPTANMKKEDIDSTRNRAGLHQSIGQTPMKKASHQSIGETPTKNACSYQQVIGLSSPNILEMNKSPARSMLTRYKQMNSPGLSRSRLKYNMSKEYFDIFNSPKKMPAQPSLKTGMRSKLGMNVRKGRLEIYSEESCVKQAGVELSQKFEKRPARNLTTIR